MTPDTRSRTDLLHESEVLRVRLDEAEDTLRALHAGEVDALVVADPGGNKIFRLQGSETPYRILVEQMHEGAVTLSNENIVLYANPRFTELLRIPLNRVMGKTFDSFVAPVDSSAFTALLHAARSAPSSGEVLGLAADGTLVPLQLALSLLPPGSAGAFCIVATDIVEQRTRAEAMRHDRDRLEARVAERTSMLVMTANALRQSEERIRATLYSIADAVIATDASNRITHMNPVAERLTGWSEAEVLGKSADGVLRLVNEHTRAPVENPITRILRDGQVTGMANHTLLIARDGSERSIADSGSAIRVGRGELAGCVLVFRDQTTERAAQARLQDLLDEAERARRTLLDLLDAKQKSDAERERLMAAIEQADEVIYITDPEGTLQYVNPAFEAVTGYKREEALGQNRSLLRSDTQPEAFHREMWRTLTGGHRWRGRLVNKRKDGTLYTEEATISPVLGVDGRIVNFVAVKRDITEQLRLAEQLQAAQKMDAIGQLAGGVGHDFNNILGVILSYTSFALEGLREGDPLGEDLAEVRDAANRAAALTRQLLAFSRRQVLQPQVLDLNAVAGNLEKMLRRLIGENIDLKQVLAPDLGRVTADPGQIEQVIMNLVVNARDAMPGGGKLTIETANVELEKEYASQHPGVTPGPYVLLAVSDDGCGMDEATLKRLFEPFFTTKEQGKGTGLGLSTAYGIVTQSGGHIRADSELGKGTTFKVYLPRQLKEELPSIAPLLLERPRGGSETILVAEDEEPVRKVTVRILRAAGYQVLAAANGGEALLICEQHKGPIHLLLTDVVMPQLGGPQLAARIQEARPALPVLYMTGYTDTAILHQGVLEHSTMLIGKPFTASNLTRKVREAIDSAAPVGGGTAAASSA